MCLEQGLPHRAFTQEMLAPVRVSGPALSNLGTTATCDSLNELKSSKIHHSVPHRMKHISHAR